MTAKIGQRHHDADPLPPSNWRQHLRDLAAAMLLAIVVMILTVFLIFAALEA